MAVRVMHLFFINEKKTSIDINISDHMIVEAGAYANAENSFVAEGNIPADDREFLGKLHLVGECIYHILGDHICQGWAKMEFRDKLKKYAVEAGFKFSYVKNDKERIRSNPLIKPTDIIKNFKQNYGLDISYYNAWYGRMKAKKLVHGAEAVSYQLLTWYVKSVKEHNPGSHCILECEPNSHRFKRLFVSYYGCIEGFRFCRPLLILDGTFVKNNYKGTLLAATGKNGNQDYPDWRWNKFWDMHMPWEDRRLFVVPPEISFYEKDEYDLEIKRVQDKSSSAVFCFYDARTDDFCFIHSVINRWAKEFPHVALYEIIIDHLKEDDRINVMREYNINCTPTFRFFQNGEKVDDLAGGSAIFLENTLNKIYGGGEWSTAQVLDTQLVKKDGNGEGVCSSFEVEAVAHDTWDTSYELKHYSKCPCNLCRSWKYLRLKLSQQRETEIEKDEK
ncbi:hypothetical protein DVH24_027240 [Malus domestica]|uniref:Thioredoxin domain-containing protein n=1 Tax=Malus domestica TaxID=3750 RepID=A0A498ISA8_MALDO|nr:hypothetical protein DVH24_027240 [Malus domestica]